MLASNNICKSREQNNGFRTRHFQNGVLETYGMHWNIIIKDIVTFLHPNQSDLRKKCGILR